MPPCDRSQETSAIYFEIAAQKDLTHGSPMMVSFRPIYWERAKGLLRRGQEMSPYDSAITETLSGSSNDTEKIKSGSPAAHRNTASFRSVSSFSKAKPARFADGSSSPNDDFLATRPKYLICLAAISARSIRSDDFNSGSTNAGKSALAPIATSCFRWNAKTRPSAAATDAGRPDLGFGVLTLVFSTSTSRHGVHAKLHATESGSIELATVSLSFASAMF